MQLTVTCPVTIGQLLVQEICVLLSRLGLFFFGMWDSNTNLYPIIARCRQHFQSNWTVSLCLLCVYCRVCDFCIQKAHSSETYLERFGCQETLTQLFQPIDHDFSLYSVVLLWVEASSTWCAHSSVLFLKLLPDKQSVHSSLTMTALRPSEHQAGERNQDSFKGVRGLMDLSRNI